jgi:hypothetical protein
LNIVVWIHAIHLEAKSLEEDEEAKLDLVRYCPCTLIMRFSAASVFVLASSAAAFQHTPTAFVARSTSASDFGSFALFSTAEDVDVEAPATRQRTKKDERLRMMKSDRFHRKGFKEVREGVENAMVQQYQSPIVKDLKTSNYLLEKDGVKVYLAKVGIILIARFPPCASPPRYRLDKF